MQGDLYLFLDKRQKPDFDIHINGTLLNKDMDVIPLIFNKGKSLKKFQNEDFYISVDKSNSELGKYRDKLSVVVNTSAPLFIVSEKMQFLLQEMAPKQVEFFKLIILDEEKSISNYKIANVINKIDCIDYKNSDLNFEFYDKEEPEGDIIRADTIVINKELVPYLFNIFLLDRCKETFIVIKEDLKKSMEERDLSGLVFSKV